MTASTKSDRKPTLWETLTSPRARGRAETIFWYIVMTALALVFMVPLLWMLSTALKKPEEIFAYPSVWIPAEAMWDNFRLALTKYPFARFIMNTFFLVGINIVGELLSVPVIAYAFARLRFPGKKIFFILMLSTLMIPSQVKMIPLFAIFAKLKLTNSYWPLFLPSFFGSPFFVFLLIQYMKTIPRELDDAARIDGCGTWGILYKIILPLCKPALAIIVVYTFLWTWNSFLDPLIYLNDINLFTVQVGLSMFKGMTGVEWNLFMAATLVVTLPILVLYFFAQRYLIGGIASVGIKG
ncbi:MAG TPA: carbohydrate ABC transporter permease [Anaerolineaceae bacterium]|nr:carbohydrate ABC transporter permease [Anaerolineaceae bacterium]HPN52656.1 carbohydrate ABC transporter permease [Anaerolineaceae bacterium]